MIQGEKLSIQMLAINPMKISTIDINNYWQYYGLSCDPFSIDLKDDFYFSLPRWEEYLDLLQFFCHQMNVILLITGAHGSGKTTLAEQFYKQAQESMQICCVKANSLCNGEKLIQLLSEAFINPINLTLSYEEQADELIASIQQYEKKSLLLIDDAHLLPNDGLQLLLYLIQQQSQTQMNLHILLVGESYVQNSFSRICHAQKEEKNYFHVIEIGLFSLDETNDYLKQRLTKAGFESFPFIQSIVNRIYKLSNGVPGRINRIAKRTLFNQLIKIHSKEKENFLRKNQAKWIGSAFCLLLFFLIFGFIYSFKLKHVFSSYEKETTHKSTSVNIIPHKMNPIIQKEQSLKQGEDIPLKIQINPVKSNTLTKKKKNTIYTKFEKHLLAIPAKQFGVQLLGGSDEEAILEFIEKYDFKNKVNYYHRHVKGEDWYVLIYGHFNSLKDAQQAINDLPEELRELNPWVRSYESIHKVIQNK